LALKKSTATQLREKAESVAWAFSQNDRAGNTLNETFDVESIMVLGETTAAVVFKKAPTDKKAVAWFYWLNGGKNKGWNYFFVTYAHLVGLEKVGDLLHEVEQHNFARSIDG